MRAARGVTVVGSVHTDLIASAAVLPSLGMSVIGTSFTVSPGGKAANQAAQIARMGVRSWLVAAVGKDAMGSTILDDLLAAGVDLTYVTRLPDETTGASTVITVSGEYASVIVPGAASHLTTDMLQRAKSAIRQSKFMVTQLELGPATATAALALAMSEGAIPVLNASPIDGHNPEAVHEAIEAAETLIVNRYEAGVIDGSTVGTRDSAIAAANRIRARYGLRTVVVTCAADGAIAVRDGAVVEQDAFPTAVADSVGAGDAFLGGLVAAWSEGVGDREGLRWGAAAGSICASGHGAFSSLPDRDAVRTLIGASSG